MKTMKYSMTFGIALVCAMLFTVCDNISEQQEILTSVENGYGRISISLTGEEAARTVFPSTVFDKFVYAFTKVGTTTGVVKVPGNDGFFTLEVGNYTVAVQAYTGNAEPYTLAASGVSAQFSVGSGNNATVVILLSGIDTGEKGELSYKVTYPADAEAVITLQKWPDMNNITLTPNNLTIGEGITETLKLEVGSYLLTALVSKDGHYAGISEAVHINSSLITVYTKDFSDTDLITAISLNPGGVYSFTAASFGYGTQSAKSVMVSNASTQATGALAVVLSGTNASNFTLSTTSIDNIAAGGNASFTVCPNTGLDAGIYTAIVAVSGSNGISVSLSVNFTVNRVSGATVIAPTLDTRTYNSITIYPVSTPSTGQSVEYGISSSNNSSYAVWQIGLTFTGLTSVTTYYIFARSAQNTNYNTGTASSGLAVKTGPYSIVLYPRGELNTYVGAPTNERIQFRAVALRENGTVIENTSGFIYSGDGVNSTGVFTPQTAGNATITVFMDGTSANTSVAVHPADYMRQPYYYPGTGKTYQGFSGGTTGNLTTDGGVTVTYPAQTTFSADGFFTLEGSVNNSAVYNYAYVVLTKDSDPDNLTTYYLVRGNFKERIWLRFGAGNYTIKVYGWNNIILSSNLGAEGDYRGGSLLGPGIIFNVTNTRNNDSSVDYSIPDKRFIYPSYVVQSDDFRITNLVADLTYGLTDNTAKIRAIHDYIVKNTVYDSASTNTDQRKKQDALTVLGTRYRTNSQYPDGHFLAVCEGYANTFATLTRAAGFEVKYISSSSMNHGWNHVYNSGWKFIDVTWDDPSPDGGPNYARYTYYLLTSLYGVSNDHYGWEVNNGRSAIGSTVPRQRGVPDGWY